MANNKIALLRGINVGGKNLIKMAELRIALERSGFQNVRTYIQSGNICFQCAGSRLTLEKRVHELIQNEFGWDVPILVRNQKYFEQLVQENPFVNQSLEMLHATLLNKKPAAAKTKAIQELDFGDDRFKILGETIYVHCPSGYSKTKLTNGFFEKKLGVPATTRNWKTINKLVDL